MLSPCAIVRIARHSCHLSRRVILIHHVNLSQHVILKMTR